MRILTALLISIAMLAPSSTFAATDTCSGSYVTDLVKGDEKIDPAAERYQAVNVFSFELNGDCRVVAKSPWVEQAAQRLRNDPKRLILIDIVNEIQPGRGTCRDLTPGEAIHTLISDPARRAEHIRQIVAIGALGQGVEIDYEHVLPQSTPFLTQFMQELRAALPAEKKLAAVVQPKTPSGGGQGGPIDWRAIEPYVDYIRVMAYYYSYSGSPPGPVVTYQTLAQLADYILNSPTQSIPRAKARLLLSLYGWDWPVSPAGRGSLIRYEQAMELIRTNGITPVRDVAQDTLHFQYHDSSNVVHEVWFNDFLAEQKRIQLLLDKDFPAIDLWHLNTGDPALWNWFTPLVRSDCPSLAAPPSPPTDARVDRLDPSTIKVGQSTTTVTIQGAGFTASDVVLISGNPVFPSAVTATSMQVPMTAVNLANAAVTHIAIAQNGRLSNSLNLYVVGNPVIDSFEPPAAPSGSRGFMLTVHGTGFEPGTVVLWNSRNVPTQFVSATEVHADIEASLITQPGTIRLGLVNPTSDARVSRPYTVALPNTIAGLPPAQFGVGPNPWKSGTNTGGIRFFGVSSENDVKIFTESGNMVRSLSASSGSAEWDLRNDSGENVASGMYFYLATAADGMKQRGILAVIH